MTIGKVADTVAILSILLKDEALSPDVNLERLSSLTDGYSGSDLKRKPETWRRVDR